MDRPVMLVTGGSRGIGASVSQSVGKMTAGMGLRLNRVHIAGASAEAEPSIRQALGVYAGQPITSLDLDAIRDRVQGVGWIKEARVVRLLPDTLVVEVKEAAGGAEESTGRGVGRRSYDEHSKLSQGIKRGEKSA